jgi:hypothetical protein
MRRLPVLTLIAAFCGTVLAQTPPPATPAAPPAPPPLGYRTVAEALAGLKARDGNGTVVTTADEWVTINEPLASAQWSFPPSTHAAYPALIRRTALRGGDGKISIATSTLCEGPAEACKALLLEFEAMNDRITQALRGRGRQGSSQPTPPRQP